MAASADAPMKRKICGISDSELNPQKQIRKKEPKKFFFDKNRFCDTIFSRQKSGQVESVDSLVPPVVFVVVVAAFVVVVVVDDAVVDDVV